MAGLSWKEMQRQSIYCDYSRPESRLLRVDPDPFLGAPNVAFLHSQNFNEFLKMKDACLVYFYTPTDKENDWMRGELLTASCSTKRANHAYASVNCYREKELCLANKVTKTPRFNMYSRGFYVGSMRDVTGFTAPIMRQYVEFSPLLTQPKGAEFETD
ncbi:hypothetical protein BsWGS_16993 [Bradybaena similaris]